jgi:hypothetical protein
MLSFGEGAQPHIFFAPLLLASPHKATHTHTHTHARTHTLVLTHINTQNFGLVTYDSTHPTLAILHPASTADPPPDASLSPQVQDYLAAMESRKLREAIRLAMAASTDANKFFTDTAVFRVSGGSVSLCVCV